MNEKLLEKLAAPGTYPAMEQCGRDLGRSLFEAAQSPCLASPQAEWDAWYEAKRTKTPEEFSAWVDKKFRTRQEVEHGS